MMMKRIAPAFFLLAAVLVSCGTQSQTGDQGTGRFLPEVLLLLENDPATETEMLSRFRNEEISAAAYGQYVIVTRTLESYEGGAHGMTTTEYRVFDREKGRVIGLADIAGETERKLLKETVELTLRENYGIPEGAGFSSAGFFEDEITLPENFFLSEKGIGFHWNPYEIAPYAMGAIEVVTPYQP
jgi:hypothetical protein